MLGPLDVKPPFNQRPFACALEPANPPSPFDSIQPISSRIQKTNSSHSSLQNSMETVTSMNGHTRTPSGGAVRTAARHRPSPMTTTQRPMRKMHDKIQPIRILPLALHPYPIASASTRRMEDMPRAQPQTARPTSVTYMRPALSPVSPVLNTVNFIDSAFRGCAERIQSELSNLRSSCSKAIFREQQEKERWRTQCVVLHKECMAARAQVQLAQRVSARHQEVYPEGDENGHSKGIPSPPSSAPAYLPSITPRPSAATSTLFKAAPSSTIPEPPPATADSDSDGEESAVHSLVHPSPRNSPRNATFRSTLRAQRCRSLPPDSELAQIQLTARPQLSPRSQLFPPGMQCYTGGASPPMVPMPFFDHHISAPSYTEHPGSSPSSPTSEAQFRRASDAGSDSSTGSTCVDSDDEAANIPISKRHRPSGSISSSSGASAGTPVGTPTEQEAPALIAVKSEQEEPSSPLDGVNGPHLLHVDLMYISKGDKLHCRACLLSKRKSLPTSPSAISMSFPLNASWDILRDHCIKEHPKESAEVSALQPAQLYALRLKLYQHQQSIGMI